MLNDIPHIQAVVDQYNGLIPVKVISEVSYSLIQGEEATTLILEGTHNLSDAKRDIEALLVDCGFGRVHAGAWHGIPEMIDAEWNNFSAGKLIRIIAHSLGGMEAGLAACGLHLRGFRNIEVVTFGCPRWGDAAAIAYFNQIPNRSYRNYNNLFEHDFFTTIPIPLLELPYVPVPNVITGWSAPTANNEWKTEGILIEAHSAEDCYLPLVTRLAA